MYRIAPATLLRAFVVLWMPCAVALGALLVSFHQPFRDPKTSDGSSILALAPISPTANPHWRAVHLLSGGCACSQRVMAHLAERGTLPATTEQVLLIDGPEPYLPGSRTLIARLQRSGFLVQHLRPADIPASSHLRGVPLLLVASPEGRVAYLGGYGPTGDQDIRILADLRASHPRAALPVLGCAIGTHLRQTLDPLHLKY